MILTGKAGASTETSAYKGTGKDVAGKQTSASPLANALTNLDAEIVAQSDVIKQRGSTFWVKFEDGLIESAKASGALFAAVDAFVTVSLANKIPK
jgi:hypothetical protein